MDARRGDFHRIGREAMLGVIDALETGRLLTCREVIAPDPPAPVTRAELVRLRVRTFRVSQHVFARMLNVAPKTLQSWEHGRNRPTGGTLRLLRVAQRHPDLFLVELRRPPKARERRAQSA